MNNYVDIFNPSSGADKLSKPPVYENALSLVRAYIDAGEKIPGGVYEIESTIELAEGESLSMSAGTEIRIGYEGLGVSVLGGDVSIVGGTISAAKTLSGWTVDSDGNFVHDWSDGLYSPARLVREMYVGGERRFMCWYPYTDEYISEDKSKFLRLRSGFTPPAENDRVEFEDQWLHDNLEDVSCAEVWMKYSFYAHAHVPILLDKPSDGVVGFDFDESIYLGHGIESYYYWVLNCPEFLHPGTFFCDRINGKIVYKPLTGEEVESFVAEIPQDSQLLRVDNSSGVDWGNITIDDVAFGMSGQRLPTTGRISNEGTIYEAAVHFQRQVSHVEVSNCRFGRTGRLALSIGGHYTSHDVSNFELTDCDFDELSSRAMRIGNGPNWSDEFGDDLKGRPSNVNIRRNSIRKNGILYPNSDAISVPALADSVIENNFVAASPMRVISYGYGFATLNKLKNVVFRGNRIDGACLKLEDAGAFYGAGIMNGVVIEDNLVSGIPVPETYPASAMYFESGTAELTCRDNVFTDIGEWDGFGSRDAMNIRYTGNKVDADLYDMTYLRQPSRNYSPVADAQWYRDNFETAFLFQFDSEQTEVDATTVQVSFSDRTFPIYREGAENEFAPPDGQWLLVLTGASKGNVYHVSAHTGTTMDVLKSPEHGAGEISIAAGDEAVVLCAQSKENEMLDANEMQDAVVEWIGNHTSTPQPKT